MPPIKITSYDFDLSAIENLKQNFWADRIAKNRWGKRFSRFYKKHETYKTINDEEIVGDYYFTSGMRACFSEYHTLEDELDDAVGFLTRLKEAFEVKGSDDTWSYTHALPYSYISIYAASSQTLWTRTSVTAQGVKISLSLDAAGGDSRRVSWFHSYGSGSDLLCELEPLEEESIGYPLSLYDSAGTIYGHEYGGLKSGTSYANILSTYGEEDRTDTRFHVDQQDRFDAFEEELARWAQKISNSSASVDIFDFTVNSAVPIVVGLGQVISYVEAKISQLEAAIADEAIDPSRREEDMDLIGHLDLCDMLQDEIPDHTDIEKIWFKFGKEIESHVVQNPDTLEWEADPSYAWWEEEQFDEIRENVKDFQAHCVVNATLFSSKVYLKRSVLDLPGWKIYWFVSAFLDVGVKAKERSWLEKLIDFVLTVVAIVLTIISENPVWLKILIVTTTVLSYAGVLSPEVQLAVAIISFGYGVYSVDFSSLSTMQMFQWAIKNINMVMNMVSMYDAIGVKKEIEEEAREKAKNKSTAQLQNEAMEYLYSGAYSQYDELYNVLYTFEPKYR